MPTADTHTALPPDLLAAAGERLFGADWQRPLARALGPLHPDGSRPSIDDRLVRRWAAGERPVADWVPRVLVKLLEREAAQTEKVCARIRELI